MSCGRHPGRCLPERKASYKGRSSRQNTKWQKGKKIMKRRNHQKGLRSRTAQAAAWLLMVLLAAGIAGGCGKKQSAQETDAVSGSEALPTAGVLLEQAETAFSKAFSVSGTMTMNLAMDYTAQGVTASLEMDADQQVENTREPESAHVTGTISVNLSGISVETESYTVKEGDSYVIYSGSDGQWQKRKTTEPAADYGAEELLEALSKVEELSMQETESGYLVEGILSGADFGAMLDPLNDLFSAGEKETVLSAKASLLFSREDQTLQSMTLDLADSYDQFVQSHLEELGFEQAKVRKLQVSMADYALNTVEEITVPEEVKTAAWDADAPEETTEAGSDQKTENKTLGQDETGSYVLTAGNGALQVTIGVPSGFSYEENSDASWLQFNKQDNTDGRTVTVVYTLYVTGETYSEEDLAQSQADSYVYMQSSGDYSAVSFTGTQIVQAAGREVSYTELSDVYLGSVYETEYNTWTVLPGGLLQCIIKENGTEEDHEKLDFSAVLEEAYRVVK